jgi:AcrR family transcriptional regulator
MKQKRLDTETRQIQIKKAVLEIIAADGLAKLTTKNLANKVGVSEGAIFRHFKHKKEIIFSIIEDVKVQLVQNQKAIAYSNKPSKEKLNDYLCNHIEYLVENKGITILLFSEAAYFNESDLKTELSDILLHQKELLTKIIKDGIDEGVWDKNIKINNFVTLYMGIPIVLNVEMILNPGNFKVKNFCKNMICLLERILE